MSAATGRALKIKRNGTTIAAVVSKSVSINNEPIDITSDDDLGFRTLLEESGTRSIDISCEGVYKDDSLVEVAAGSDPDLLTVDTIEFPSGSTIAGSFRLNSVEISGEVAGRAQFSAALQSSGEWTYTAAP
jgi:predicted secreted protein